MAAPPPVDLPIDDILPPEDGRTQGHGQLPPRDSEVSRILAKWLDEYFRIPGTQFRFGLDPLMGAFPGIGDLLASSAGLVILMEGVRLRVSVFVLARMGFNMLVNAVLNLIPGVGTVGSAVFKSNSRNLALLRRWQEGQAHQVRRQSIFVMLSLVLVMALVIGFWIALWVAYIGLIKSIWDRLFGA